MESKYCDTLLLLQNGQFFTGKSVGKRGLTRGEVCFLTSMTGYQHSLTDPSFAGQVMLFTFPHIGNVGINNADYERSKSFVKGVILREEISTSYHHQGIVGLQQWLEDNSIVGICGIDTRAITHCIRKYGTQNCVICPATEKENGLVFLQECPNMEGSELTQSLVAQDPLIGIVDIRNKKSKTIVVVDFGLKQSICNHLDGHNIKIVPAGPGFADEVLAHKPHGIVLSNGPGDPEATQAFATSEVQKLTATDIPLFAICLGHQLLAISYGCSTIKMHHGHRGSNHPVYCTRTGKVLITSHNHGFVIDSISINNNIEVTYRSLFDKSIEGIRIKGKNIFSVQYHPEGSPGTHDANHIFEEFLNAVTST